MKEDYYDFNVSVPALEDETKGASSPGTPREPDAPAAIAKAPVDEPEEAPSVSAQRAPLSFRPSISPSTSPPASPATEPTSGAAAKTEPSVAITARTPDPPKESGSQTPHESPLDMDAASASLRIGIAGGRSTGKTYLFQAMVYRTQDGGRAGVMSGFLGDHANSVYTGHDPKAMGVATDQDFLIGAYKQWTRIEPTSVPSWWRLQLQYNTGWFGKKREKLNLTFLDAPGEDFSRHHIANAEFKDARVMVFCLPIWAVFHDPSRLTRVQAEDAANALKDFREIVGKYKHALEQDRTRHKVRVIVALTMADDARSSAEDVKEAWITPFVDATTVSRSLKMLRTQGGLSTYLAAARRVSRVMEARLREHPDTSVSTIPFMLDFSEGRPWFLPVTAINGARLQVILGAPEEEQRRLRLEGRPVPAHVELPLLIALCEETNALM
jgi:hypothetical protein